jgi:hypothetical protein
MTEAGFQYLAKLRAQMYEYNADHSNPQYEHLGLPQEKWLYRELPQSGV